LDANARNVPWNSSNTDLRGQNCAKAKKNLVAHFDVVDHKLFDTKLNSEIERWTSADSLVTHSAIELYADQIASSIATCAKSAKIPSVKKKPAARNMPWWSNELCALRTRARVAYKAWTRVGDAEHGSRFRLAKATYQRELRREKEKSSSEFKLTSSSTDTFAALAQFTGKSKSIPPTSFYSYQWFSYY
jgi:hypothetical protein